MYLLILLTKPTLHIAVFIKYTICSSPLEMCALRDFNLFVRMFGVSPHVFVDKTMISICSFHTDGDSFLLINA